MPAATMTSSEFARTRAGSARSPADKLRKRAASWIDRATTNVQADVPLLEGLLRRIEPTLSLRQVRARVEAIQPETHDVTTFVLRPNARFAPYQAGSYVTLRLRIGGRSVQRAYSISSAPARDGLISITVKRVPGGVVSNHLADHLRVGDVLTLSGPSGQFVLPESPPPELVMISAGSGITPVMSMLRQLRRMQSNSAVTFLHFARTPEDVIFAEELARIAAEAKNVRVHLCVEQADERWQEARGRFTEALLESVAPRYRELPIYMCGPSPFMQVVMATLESSGADLANLRYERFNSEFDASKFLTHSHEVRFLRSKREVIANRPRTLLEEAESLGLSVESGCRAGNCGTCRCRKLRGVVVDAITGRESTADAEYILPCVSIPKGVVELDL